MGFFLNLGLGLELLDSKDRGPWSGTLNMDYRTRMDFVIDHRDLH